MTKQTRQAHLTKPQGATIPKVTLSPRELGGSGWVALGSSGGLRGGVFRVGRSPRSEGGRVTNFVGGWAFGVASLTTGGVPRAPVLVHIYYPLTRCVVFTAHSEWWFGVFCHCG